MSIMSVLIVMLVATACERALAEFVPCIRGALSECYDLTGTCDAGPAALRTDIVACADEAINACLDEVEELEVHAERAAEEAYNKLDVTGGRRGVLQRKRITSQI